MNEQNYPCAKQPTQQETATTCQSNVTENIGYDYKPVADALQIDVARLMAEVDSLNEEINRKARICIALFYVIGKTKDINLLAEAEKYVLEAEQKKTLNGEPM